jgi:hypothetical protein
MCGAKYNMIMEARDYLRKELKLIAEKFPNVNIRYGYDNIIDTHIIELLPLIEYNTNDELDKAWIPLSISFLDNYMDEEIAFVSSDSSLSIKNVLFEFNPFACTEKNIMSELFGVLTYTPVNYSFPTEMQDGIIIKNNGINLINNPVEKLNEDGCLDYSYLYPIAA